MSVESNNRGDSSDNKSDRSPKVLFGGETIKSVLPQTAPQDIVPTPKPLFGVGKPPTKGDRPKVLLGGKLRIRVECSVEILRAFDVQVPAHTAKQALTIVNGTNIEVQTFEDVLRFGEQLQAKHGQVTEDSIKLAAAPVFVTGRMLRHELSVLFRQLPPDMVRNRQNKSLGQQLLSLLAPRLKAKEVLDIEYPKLRMKVAELSALEKDWQKILTEVTTLISDIETTLADADAFVLAATFLIDHLRKLLQAEDDAKKVRQYQTQEEALRDRVYSLRMTRVTLMGGQVALQTLRTNTKQYLAVGQTMSAVNLPAWHTAFVSSLLAAQNDNPVQEGRFKVLREIHATIINQLNN